jgi:GNAT superfamily N-acetyltransferase
MTIRTPLETDAGRIAVLCTELGYPATQLAIRDRLGVIAGSKTDLGFVAVTADFQVVGWIQVHLSTVVESGFRAEIVGLIVSPKQRRSGIGRALVDAAEKWAKAQHAPAMVVRSNITREESHRFYPSIGYVETKVQRIYKKGL